MKQKYHRSLMYQALENQVSPAALETMTAANLGQDALRYQIGHNHFHYDSNSFLSGDAYLEEQRRAVSQALTVGDASSAWRAFGRLSHAAQDFYAHSNYVALWRERHPEAAPDQISPLLGEALTDPRLHSGRLYYPLEVLSFIPILRSLVLPLLPRDSHAWMNKDDPSRPDFALAYAAALKRTELEYQKAIEGLSPAQVVLFAGRP